MAAASDGGGGVITIHIDASAFIAASVSTDIHHDDAIRGLEAAVRNKCQLIISYVVILEAIGAVRKKIITSRRRRTGSEEERAEAEAHADEVVVRMLTFAYDLARQGILKIVEWKGDSLDFILLSNKALVHRGRAVDDGGKMYRYRGIGAYDLIHYAFAEDVGASVIITSDAAFADIEGNDDKFGHIRVQLTGGPLIDLLGGGGQDEGQGAVQGRGGDGPPHPR